MRSRTLLPLAVRPAWKEVVSLAAVAALTAALIAATAVSWYYLSIIWEPAAAAAAVTAGASAAEVASAVGSKYTIQFMSTAARMSTLRRTIAHYSRCPSVAEIVLVWNRGQPPVPGRDFRLAVPVRVRVEQHNSLNNRFKPDPALGTRAVLHLDDDILMRCSDIERGFQAWQHRPEALVGYFPRLLLPPTAAHSRRHRGSATSAALVLASRQGAAGGAHYLGERTVFSHGSYNAILTGAAFLDGRLAVQLYGGTANAPGRVLVDRHMNCEDLLMNFLFANHTQHAQPSHSGAAVEGRKPRAEQQPGAAAAVEYVRPSRRLDISKVFSTTGLSRKAGHSMARANCVDEFETLFGGLVLPEVKLVWGPGQRPPWCPSFGCVYL